MEKSKLSFLIFFSLLVCILFILFFVLETTFTFKFVAVSIVFGPGMGISYGLENPTFNPGAHLFTLLIVNILAVIIIYVFLRKFPLEKKFENKFLEKINQQLQGSQKDMELTMIKVSKKFQSYFGNIGFYLAFALITFTYGPYTTGALSFFIMIKIKQAMISITIGSFLSIVFWWYLAIGAIPLITPTMVFVVVTGASLLSMGYGLIKERQIINAVRTEILQHRKRINKKLKFNPKKQS